MTHLLPVHPASSSTASDYSDNHSEARIDDHHTEIQPSSEFEGSEESTPTFDAPVHQAHDDEHGIEHELVVPVEDEDDGFADLIQLQPLQDEQLITMAINDNQPPLEDHYDEMHGAAEADEPLILHHNVPPAVEHFIGVQHENILNSVFDNITVDNTNPFVVVLGGEGMGKSCVVSTLCHDLLEEENQLFKNGIIYIDLFKWHKLYKYRTFEECLIYALQECGLIAYWIEQFDDFLELTPMNVFSKFEQYLSNSLLVFEDFDRFTEANNISLDESNTFLFTLFENISLNTKIVITSRKKLPIYYNFNLFRTRFYELSSFSKQDTIAYLLAYCPVFEERDLESYLDDIRDLTAYKPVFLFALYNLWQSVRMFESSFDAIITLYQQLDKPQLLIAHNAYNDRNDIHQIVPYNNASSFAHTQTQLKPLPLPSSSTAQTSTNYHVQDTSHNVHELPTDERMQPITASNRRLPPIALKNTTSDKSTPTISNTAKAKPQWHATSLTPTSAIKHLTKTTSLERQHSDPLSGSDTDGDDDVDHNGINSSPSSHGEVAPDTPPESKNQGPPLFAYTNIYALTTPHSPSVGNESYHSPLSTINGGEFSWMRRQSDVHTNRLRADTKHQIDSIIESPRNVGKKKRSEMQSFYRNSAANKNGQRRISDVQQFFKVGTMPKQRYSFADRHQYDQQRKKTKKKQKQKNDQSRHSVEMKTSFNYPEHTETSRKVSGPTHDNSSLLAPFSPLTPLTPLTPIRAFSPLATIHSKHADDEAYTPDPDENDHSQQPYALLAKSNSISPRRNRSKSEYLQKVGSNGGTKFKKKSSLKTKTTTTRTTTIAITETQTTFSTELKEEEQAVDEEEGSNFKDKLRKKFGKKKHSSLMRTSFTMQGESKREKRTKTTFKKSKSTSTPGLMSLGSDSEDEHEIDPRLQLNHHDKKEKVVRVPTPQALPTKLNANNLQTHLNIISLNDLNLDESGTNDADMDISKFLAMEDHHANINNGHHMDGNRHVFFAEDANDDDEELAQRNGWNANPVNETYDGFLAALGAEIQRQQQDESQMNDGRERSDSNDSNQSNYDPKKRRKKAKKSKLARTSFGEGGKAQSYNIRIDGVDGKKWSTNKYGNGEQHRASVGNIPPSGYLHVFDMPATPPLSSCGGTIRTDGSDYYVDDVINDYVAVTSETLRQNKLMSIHLMQHDDDSKYQFDENAEHESHRKHSSKKHHKKHSKKHKKHSKKHGAKDLPQKPPVHSKRISAEYPTQELHVQQLPSTNINPNARSEPNLNANSVIQQQSNGASTLKVGDVYFNKFLRITLLINLNADSWSRVWLINGVARALRTQDIRFSVHKDMAIAESYSYVSLLCRCDEYDIKQIKNTFEMTFISRELENCVKQSVGKPKMKIICASCVSYRHYQYLYPKEFLRWFNNSLPEAATVEDVESTVHGLGMEADGAQYSRIEENQRRQVFHHPNGVLNEAESARKVERKHYAYSGMNKMNIVNADYIQLPFAQKDILSREPMTAQKQQVFEHKFGVGLHRYDRDEEEDVEEYPLLTPPNMTVLHFMSAML